MNTVDCQLESPRVNPKWDWVVCKYNLRHENEGKPVIWNMKPTIVLSHPSQGVNGVDYPDPLVKLFIDTEKSLQFSPEVGWNWHKSWNIPNISVRLDITSKTNSNEHYLCPKNLYVLGLFLIISGSNLRCERCFGQWRTFLPE